jgi:hypothetical protein
MPNVVSWSVVHAVVIAGPPTCYLEVWVVGKLAQSDGYVVEVQVIPQI